MASGKILAMNASSVVKISTGDAGRYSRSFGLSGSFASPPFARVAKPSRDLNTREVARENAGQ
jgi:hypothetical protein